MTTPAHPARQVILPIRVGLDPMEKLLIATIKDDPEFEGIEPQVFDDAINGKGMRVLRYRKNGKVDVYWQPGVHVDSSTFTVGAGLGDFAETPIEPARFEITEQGVDLHLAFTDAQGRNNELQIREAAGERGFPLLAPVGADVEKPTRLFLVYMPDIKLVRFTGSLFEGHIGDRPLHSASFPIPLHGHRWRFIRYVAGPVIGTLNPPTHQPLVVEVAVPGNAEVDGMSAAVDAHGSVARLTTGQEANCVEVEFLPSFPSLVDLPNGGSASGRWSIQITGVHITGGTYGLSREGLRAALELDVTEHWRPIGLPLSMELFTRVVGMFRTWPATYRWRGTVKLGAKPAMSGAWERTGKR
jgi:hypothetical protein